MMMEEIDYDFNCINALVCDFVDYTIINKMSKINNYKFYHLASAFTGYSVLGCYALGGSSLRADYIYY